MLSQKWLLCLCEAVVTIFAGEIQRCHWEDSWTRCWPIHVALYFRRWTWFFSVSCLCEIGKKQILCLVKMKNPFLNKMTISLFVFFWFWRSVYVCIAVVLTWFLSEGNLRETWCSETMPVLRYSHRMAPGSAGGCWQPYRDGLGIGEKPCKVVAMQFMPGFNMLKNGGSMMEWLVCWKISRDVSKRHVPTTLSSKIDEVWNWARTREGILAMKHLEASVTSSSTRS